MSTFLLGGATGAAFSGPFRSTNGHVFCELSNRGGVVVTCVSNDEAEPTLILHWRPTEEEAPEQHFGCDGRVAYSIWSLRTRGGVKLKNTCTRPGLEAHHHGMFLRPGHTVHDGRIYCRGGSYFDPVICTSYGRGFKLG